MPAAYAPVQPRVIRGRTNRQPDAWIVFTLLPGPPCQPARRQPDAWIVITDGSDCSGGSDWSRGGRRQRVREGGLIVRDGGLIVRDRKSDCS